MKVVILIQKVNKIKAKEAILSLLKSNLMIRCNLWHLKMELEVQKQAQNENKTDNLPVVLLLDSNYSVC